MGMTTRSNHVDLRALFSSLQEEMCAALKTKRKHIPHQGTKGTSSEARWANWLEAYLPTRYQIQHSALVVDVDGKVSEQQDIVVFDRQYTPFLLNQDGTVYIPAEGVYAVFEAKQDMSAERIRYAGKKAESVRQLRRTSTAIPYAGGKYAAKEPPRILCGLLALDSAWVKGRWAAHAKRALSGLSPLRRLDLLSVLKEGSAAVQYGGSGPSLSVSEESLSFLFLSLLQGLQGMGTVPAIDFEEYRRSIPTRNV